MSDGLQTKSLLLSWLNGGGLGKAFEIVAQNNLSKNRVVIVLPFWDAISMDVLNVARAWRDCHVQLDKFGKAYLRNLLRYLERDDKRFTELINKL